MSKIDGLRDPSSEWIPGAVEYTGWHTVPWTERKVVGVYGEVRIVNSMDGVGFTLEGDNQANWIALVRGSSGLVHAIPGCKVASVTFDTPQHCADFVELP